MKLCELKKISKKTYNSMLDYLAAVADTFAFIEEDGEDSSINNTKKKLTNNKHHEEKVLKWESGGTASADIESMPIKTLYKCNNESISYLKEYDNFTKFDSSVDMSFYIGDICILYTCAHENFVVIVFEYWDDFFKEHSQSIISKSWEDKSFNTSVTDDLMDDFTGEYHPICEIDDYKEQLEIFEYLTRTQNKNHAFIKLKNSNLSEQEKALIVNIIGAYIFGDSNKAITAMLLDTIAMFRKK